MKHLKPLTSKGLEVFLVDDGHFKLKGLSSLPGNLRAQAKEYAKIHKQQILFEIRMQDKTIQGGGGALSCPARCKQTGKCYGIAYFDGKPGKVQSCIPTQCDCCDQLKQYLKRNQR